MATLCVGTTEDKTSNTVTNTRYTLRHLSTATRLFNECRETEEDLKTYPLQNREPRKKHIEVNRKNPHFQRAGT